MNLYLGLNTETFSPLFNNEDQEKKELEMVPLDLTSSLAHLVNRGSQTTNFHV